jgi:2-keto-4-pentenoate hydratase/2-oxohepta-3-ene-1,7-dioic acid hydratase in catechol pathway
VFRPSSAITRQKSDLLWSRQHTRRADSIDAADLLSSALLVNDWSARDIQAWRCPTPGTLPRKLRHDAVTWFVT